MDELGEVRSNAAIGFPAGIMHSGGHHQKIVRIFIQMVIRLGKERQAGRVPHDLIDADHLRSKVVKIQPQQPWSRQRSTEKRCCY